MAKKAIKTVPKVKSAKKPNAKKNIVIKNNDGTISTIPKTELPKLKREAKQELQEQIVALSKPNTVYLTSADFPAGADLNWQEVIEAIMAAKFSCTTVSPPIGPAAVKAYMWWFMIDRLRSVGGLYPEPTTLVVPTFPDNGNIPSGWAKFVEYLMPYRDPITKTTYQFRYNYTYGLPAGSATPATTSSVLNPSAPAGDFSFSALQNFFLVPSPIPVPGSLNELTWTFVNNAFNFQTDVVASNSDISQWIASNGGFTEACKVPFMAPDASAVAIPYAHNVNNNWNPGVYCQTKNFDPEMACIIHPPQTTITLNVAAYTNIVPFDWKVSSLPQTFNAGVVKTFPAGSNLAQPGQLELIVSYGYITQNTAYVIGHRAHFLAMGQKLWPHLTSYCPFLYPLNNIPYHQASVSVINMLSVNSINNTPAGGVVVPGELNDPADYMTLMAFFESKYIARTTEYAYMGLIFNTTDDVVSQTQFASEFRDAASNPVLEDILDTWAPTVRHGRLVVYYQDYRPITSYGMTYNPNLAAVNVNIARWLQIGNDFASANGNINDFAPQVAGVFQGLAIGPFVFNPQQTGSATWVVRGPGQNAGAPNWSTPITSASLGQTIPSLPTYALGNTICPAAPCLYGPRIILKSMEIMGAGGLGTWVSFNYAKLGGYCNQTQVTAVVEPDNTVVSVTSGVGGLFINLNYRYIPQKLGSYFPLDKESVGRSLAYSPRTSFNSVADRFPSLQAIGGNSSVQDALVANTQMGPGSAYNRIVQAKLTEGLNAIESCRAALGAFHVDIIPNFSGDEMVTYLAVELIYECKKFVSVAPYHTEHAASLTSYNSPNVFESFINTILDIGDRIVGTIGNVVGSVTGSGGGSFIGEIAGGLVSNLLMKQLGTTSQVHSFDVPAVPPQIKPVAPVFKKIVTTVSPVDRNKIKIHNEKKIAVTNAILAKLPVKRFLDIPQQPQPNPDQIANLVLGMLATTPSFYIAKPH
jgi:hypothetical protein